MRNGSRLGKVLRYPSTTGVLLLVLMLAVNVALQPSFLGGNNISNLLQVGLPLVLATLAQAVVILAGGIDLSIGGIMSLVDVVTVMGQTHFGLAGAAALALLLALLIGLVNAVVITYGRVQPLVATLASSFVASGAALLVLAQPGGSIPNSLSTFYSSSPAGVPFPLYVVVAALLCWWWVKARYGRWIYALGGSEQNAVRNAVPVERVRMAVYTMSGFMAGIAGLALTLEVASGDPSIGQSFLLPSIAAVVLGGTSLTGGYGGLVGPAAGALALTDVNNIVFFAGVPSYYTSIVSSGVVLVGIALATNVLQGRRRISLRKRSAER